MLRVSDLYRPVVQVGRSTPWFAAFLALCVLEPLAMALVPLLATLGPFRALIDAAILAPFAAALGAVAVVDQKTESPPAILDAWCKALLQVLFGLALLLSLSLLIGLIGGLCDPWYGLGFFAFGPLVSLIFSLAVGVAWAAFLLRISRRASRRWLVFGAFSLPLLSYGYAFARFYTSPAIFSFGHFFGYFPGTLYDTDVSLEARHFFFRALTLLWTFALLGFSAGGEVFLRRATLARTITALFFAVALAVEWHGDRLHFSSSSAVIGETLGAELSGPQCRVVVPRELPRANRERFLFECEFRVQQARTRLGIAAARTLPRVVVYLFRSAEEKRLWMGASHTDIAKPWRHELFVEQSSEPHPVLFHEIVHVVAASIGRGPFQVATLDATGLIPNGAVIEGLAVAVAWESREGLTTHQWARSMLDLNLLPHVEELLGPRFTFVRASRAYVAAGSFVRFVLDSKGARFAERLYHSTSLAQALGEPLADVETRWLAFLRRTEVPGYARSLAEARFVGAGVLSQVCPHQVAHLEERLAGEMGARDLPAAIVSCQAIAQIDAARSDMLAQAAMLRADADDAHAEDALRELRQRNTPRHWIARVFEELGDRAARAGQREQSMLWYQRMLAEPIGRDLLRQARAKIWSQQQAPDVAQAFAEILAGTRREHDEVLFGARIQALRNNADAQVGVFADYLLAKQLLARGFYPEAIALMLETHDGVLRERYLQLPDPEFVLEADRMLAIALSISARAREPAHEYFLERALARTRLRREDGIAIEIADALARVRQRPSAQPAPTGVVRHQSPTSEGSVDLGSETPVAP